MFNLFRKKHKRSEWFEGLLDAEDQCEHLDGYLRAVRQLDLAITHGWLSHNSEWVIGFREYLTHYKNTLSKI